MVRMINKIFLMLVEIRFNCELLRGGRSEDLVRGYQYAEVCDAKVEVDF